MWNLIIMYLLLIPAVAVFIHNKHKFGADMPRTVAIKAACTTIIAVTAVWGTAAAPAEWRTYVTFITVGLILGLIGDIVICQKGTGGFLSGMIYFALGHVCYIVGFLQISKYAKWSIPIFAILYLSIVLIVRKLDIHPGKLTVPAAVYCAIIIFMVSLAATAAFSLSKGFIVLTGAILFAISDGILAYGTFGKKHTAKVDTFGLYCYFTGQSLFAVTIYCFI